MGAAFTDEPFELERLLALAIGLLRTVALWWCYFQRAEPLGEEGVKCRRPAAWVVEHVDAHADRARADRIAVADELAIAHPGDDSTIGFTILAFGGPALFSCSPSFYSIARCSALTRSRGRWV